MKDMVKLRWLLSSFLSVSLIAPAVKAAPIPSFDLNANQNQSEKTVENIQIQVPRPQSSSNYTKPIPSGNQLNNLNNNLNQFNPGLFAGVVPLHSPIKVLEPQIKALMAQYSYLKSGMFFLDLDTGNYIDIGGDKVFPAASTIKLPILVAFFQDLDAGKVSLEENLTMRGDLMTGGSGDMQYESPGKKYTARETLFKMITISDNTATNMIIDRLGGIARLNQRFRSWGLKDTIIRHPLADLSGTNTTSSKDLARALALVVNSKLLSSLSQERVLYILRQSTIKTLLPAGLGKGAVIANKTGDIGFLIGDAGYITTPTGKHYLAAIFVRRPYDDHRAKYFVSGVSRLVYNYLTQPAPVAQAGSSFVSP